MTIAQEKWSKGELKFSESSKLIGSKDHPNLVNHVFIKNVRACFNHLSITCDMMTPFLKGMHNTIDGWRQNRHHEGWKEKEDIGRIS